MGCDAYNFVYFQISQFHTKNFEKICQLKRKNNNMKYILAQYFMLRLGNITCRLDYMGQKHLKSIFNT